jgi:hypothetical protein
MDPNAFVVMLVISSAAAAAAIRCVTPITLLFAFMLPIVMIENTNIKVNLVGLCGFDKIFFKSKQEIFNFQASSKA